MSASADHNGSLGSSGHAPGARAAREPQLELAELVPSPSPLQRLLGPGHCLAVYGIGPDGDRALAQILAPRDPATVRLTPEPLFLPGMSAARALAYAADLRLWALEASWREERLQEAAGQAGLHAFFGPLLQASTSRPSPAAALTLNLAAELLMRPPWVCVDLGSPLMRPERGHWEDIWWARRPHHAPGSTWILLQPSGPLAARMDGIALLRGPRLVWCGEPGELATRWGVAVGEGLWERLQGWRGEEGEEGEEGAWGEGP